MGEYLCVVRNRELSANTQQCTKDVWQTSLVLCRKRGLCLSLRHVRLMNPYVQYS